MGRPAKRIAPVFGTNMAKCRRKCGLSQAQLAELLNISGKAVDYYERRALNPNAELVQKVAKILGVTPDQLLGFSNNQNIKPGPTPKIVELIDEIQRLSKPKQKIAVQFLETLVKS